MNTTVHRRLTFQILKNTLLKDVLHLINDSVSFSKEMFENIFVFNWMILIIFKTYDSWLLYLRIRCYNFYIFGRNRIYFYISDIFNANHPNLLKLYENIWANYRSVHDRYRNNAWESSRQFVMIELKIACSIPYKIDSLLIYHIRGMLILMFSRSSVKPVLLILSIVPHARKPVWYKVSTITSLIQLSTSIYEIILGCRIL